MGDIHDAARNGDLRAVMDFTQSDPDSVLDKDDCGNTPLHIAAKNEHLEGVEFLLNHASNPRAVNDLYETPLHMAVVGRYGIKDEDDTDSTDVDRPELFYTDSMQIRDGILHALVCFGADMNAMTLVGRTPLHYAVEFADSHTVEWLVDNGADVNAVGRGYSTVLSLAIQRSDLYSIRSLLEHGANVHAIDLIASTIALDDAIGMMQIIIAYANQFKDANVFYDSRLVAHAMIAIDEEIQLRGMLDAIEEDLHKQMTDEEYAQKKSEEEQRNVESMLNGNLWGSGNYRYFRHEGAYLSRETEYDADDAVFAGTTMQLPDIPPEKTNDECDYEDDYDDPDAILEMLMWTNTPLSFE